MSEREEIGQAGHGAALGIDHGLLVADTRLSPEDLTTLNRVAALMLQSDEWGQVFRSILSSE